MSPLDFVSLSCKCVEAVSKIEAPELSQSFLWDHHERMTLLLVDVREQEVFCCSLFLVVAFLFVTWMNERKRI